MDEKIEKSFGKFKIHVLNDAQRERDKLEKEADEKAEKTLSEMKRELSAAADKKLQNNAVRLEKENREKILQAEMNAKKELITYREKIVDDVFGEVKERLLQYRESEEYTKWLNEKAEKALSECGEGEKVLFINKADKEKISCFDGKLEACEIIGGVKAVNSTKGIVADYTFDEMLSEERRIFIKNSGLAVGM